MSRKFFFIENRLRYFRNNRLELAKNLALEGNEVHCATLEYYKEDFDSLHDEIFNIHVSDRYVNYDKVNRNSIRYICKLVNQYDPDIIHIFTINSIVKVGLGLFFQKRRNIVCSITGLGYSFISNGIKAKLIRAFTSLFIRLFIIKHNVDFIFQNSDDVLLFKKKLRIFKFNSTLILGSGVNTERFIPKLLANPIPVILFGGRLLKDKGIFEFIEACNIIYKKDIQAKFLIAGDIDRENPSGLTETQLNQILNNSVFQYLGYQKNMAELISTVDIVCLPSYREGLSKFLIEAASCGKPIITTNVPGCREVVEDNINGFIVEAKEVDSLATALEKLILDESQRLSFGSQSRNIAIKKFSMDSVVKEIKKVYSYSK